jgi:hypothetical protein
MTSSPERLMAMTTNERLYDSGLLEAFNAAEKEKDAHKVREILRAVYVDEASIDCIINHWG